MEESRTWNFERWIYEILAVGLVARGENRLEGHVRNDRQRGKWQRVNGATFLSRFRGDNLCDNSANLSMWKYRYCPCGHTILFCCFFGLNKGIRLDTLFIPYISCYC